MELRGFCDELLLGYIMYGALSVNSFSPYSIENRVCVRYPMQTKRDKQHKPNASIPNAKYIPLAHVGYAGGRVG